MACTGVTTDRSDADINGDYILAWQVAGPYKSEGEDGLHILDIAFIPETVPDHPSIVWRDQYADDSQSPGMVKLSESQDPGNYCTFARTCIDSEADQTVQLHIRSDDGVKVWINGELVFETVANHDLMSGPDVVDAPLKRGWNTVMFKVGQGAGDGSFACMIGDSSGDPAKGVRVDPHRLSGDRPHDAISLFDGSSKDEWCTRDGRPIDWSVDDGDLVIEPGGGDAVTRELFEDFSLHLEFICPDAPEATVGQARSNSGVYIFDSYEVQILDSWGLPSAPDGCGALYRLSPPNVNACARPGVWQTYDIEFIAPRWDEMGKKLSDARVTVVHNGVLVQNDVRVGGPTGQGRPERPGLRPIVLQDHGTSVRFRNIWIVRHPSWRGPEAPGFQNLFNGQNLDGWMRLGGEAEYKIENDVIVGETRPNQPNTFLCTKQKYEDFVLELEFRVDEELNSGIQIRSNSNAEYHNGRVHGYQVEIDPSERAWSAGIYDESRRGWLSSLDRNERARNAFQHDDWNRLRIVANGPVFRTYLNNVPAALLVDGTTQRGFIGLQVHGVGARTDPLRVSWRDIRIREISPVNRQADQE